ncbi:MAG: hypothetical protein ACXVZW_02440 [Gaiellaceae bacterium]
MSSEFRSTALQPGESVRRYRARRGTFLRKRNGGLRIRRVVLLALLVVLAPVLYSYVTTMMRPSSLPLGVRSVEWMRANGAAWLVNDVENVYYRWTAPKKGGPTLKTLPKVGKEVPATAVPVKHRSRAHAAPQLRPARVAPVIRPALPGEGVWRATGQLVGGAPPVLVTSFRSDPSYPRTVAYVAWMDHTRTQLALYPGRYEPPSATPRGPMAVPTSQRSRLLATFNAGFTYKDGHGGFVLNGRTYEPLQHGIGTIVGYRDGRVDIVTWRGGSTAPRRVVLASQNLPLIIDKGRPNPNLSDGPQWGFTLGNAIRVWRSGLGIDRRGNLVYAAAPYQTVGSLASILIHAGAVRAVELDINTEWPTFNTYARRGAGDPSMLVPTGMHSPMRYLVPDDRDFFAVYRPAANGSARVPLG